MKEFIEQAAQDADEITVEAIEQKDQLPPEAMAALRQVELAHENYQLCTPNERLWVLENKPHMLFLEGEYGIAERKLVQQGIRELHNYLASTVNIHDVCPTIQ